MVIQTKQCACRWILRHQHKLKQAARSCHLKVKEALGVEDVSRPYEHEKVEPHPLAETFRYADLKTTLAEPHQLRLKPDVSELKFGHIFTDHMLKAFYHEALGGWQKPEIIPFENISLHPAAKVLHYAVELFEGLKAFRGVDGRVRIFRPDMNMHRMNLSAKTSGLPTFDSEEMLKCLKRLIAIDQEWVPHAEGASLYIRPTLIGVDGTLGVAQSESALMFTILCPVGNYFSSGSDAVSLLADPTYARAWPGGCGDRKVGSNYGPTIRVQKKASKRGLQQVLWLYGDDHQVTEVGTMNIFMFYINEDGEKELVTPPLNGLILPGVTRASIIQMAQEWGDFRVVQRIITMNEIVLLLKENRLLEMFGSGTACIVSPIASVSYLGNLLRIPTTEHSAPLFKKIREQLYAIQYGHIKHPWGVLVDRP